MLWQKEIVIATVSAGTAAANTNKIKGRIEQMVVIPLDSNGDEVTASDWDLDVIDRDNDVLWRLESESGRMDFRNVLPVGRDDSEKLTFSFSNVTATPATMRVVLKIKEN